MSAGPFHPATVLRAMADAYEAGHLERVNIHMSAEPAADGPNDTGLVPHRTVWTITVTGKPDPALYGYLDPRLPVPPLPR